MEETTLLILAAGMGSRFGGLKQIEPVDDNGNFIIDYSIYDAIRAGFNKVVFVIKRENLEIFKNTVGNRISDFVKIDYAFQEFYSYLPEQYKNIERVKPWGTAHAVLCARDKVSKKFAIINADDFYGFEAFRDAYKFLNEALDNNYGVLGYKVGKTLTENGAVKRGVCKQENGKLIGIAESLIEKVDGEIVATTLSDNLQFKLDFNSPVSMNFMCLHSNIFEFLQKDFEEFLKGSTNIEKDEYLIQNAMFNKFRKENIKIDLISTNATWFGFTYKEDKPGVVSAIKGLVTKGKYPINLWNK